VAQPRLRTPAAVALSVLVTLLAIDAGFRIHAHFAGTPRFVGIERYPSNPRGYFRPCENGLYCPDFDRDPIHGCAAPLEPGKSQVLFVGDSFTFGQGVDAVDAYPSLIEFPGEQRRNCAVGGNAVWDVQRDLVAQVEKYHPRLVIYGMVLNDFGMFPPDEKEFADVGGQGQILDYMNFRTMNLDKYLASRHEGGGLALLLRLSETARYFYRASVVRRISRETLEGYRKAFQGDWARKNFDLIRDMAKRSPRFLVVLFPLFVHLDRYPLADVHALIRAELARSGIQVLDLLDAYRGMDASKLVVFETDQHPSYEAHRIAASAVREKLGQLGWLSP
jgi:hypothetical protein